MPPRHSVYFFLLTRALSVAPAENLGTVVAGTLIASPVFGLRPLRALRRTVAKVPKPADLHLTPTLHFAGQRIDDRLHDPGDFSARQVSVLSGDAVDKFLLVQGLCFPRSMKDASVATRGFGARPNIPRYGGITSPGCCI